jgi:hypothetical protein
VISDSSNYRFQFEKPSQLFINVHNETFSVVAMRANNPDARPLESIADLKPQLQPARFRFSPMTSSPARSRIFSATFTEIVSKREWHPKPRRERRRRGDDSRAAAHSSSTHGVNVSHFCCLKNLKPQFSPLPRQTGCPTPKSRVRCRLTSKEPGDWPLTYARLRSS